MLLPLTLRSICAYLALAGLPLVAFVAVLVLTPDWQMCERDGHAWKRPAVGECCINSADFHPRRFVGFRTTCTLSQFQKGGFYLVAATLLFMLPVAPWIIWLTDSDQAEISAPMHFRISKIIYVLAYIGGLFCLVFGLTLLLN